MIGHWTEYAIVLLMFVTIVGFGFLEGVGIGMLVTTAFFAVCSHGRHGGGRTVQGDDADPRRPAVAGRE